MVKPVSLVSGIGDDKTTEKYYDDWSNRYDYTLNKWNYTAPEKSIILLKKKLNHQPKSILDMACGTGLFGYKLKKNFNNSQIYGSDISKKSLELAKKKRVYSNLSNINFEKKKNYKIKFELVSMIGAMTYCKNFDKLFSNVNYYLLKNGHFIFSHRIDLWEKQDFDKILTFYKSNFKTKFISRPQKYLPLNEDFKDKIKIRLVLLKKI